MTVIYRVDFTADWQQEWEGEAEWAWDDTRGRVNASSYRGNWSDIHLASIVLGIDEWERCRRKVIEDQAAIVDAKRELPSPTTYQSTSRHSPKPAPHQETSPTLETALTSFEQTCVHIASRVEAALHGDKLPPKHNPRTLSRSMKPKT